jgi:hypothetical protein
VSIKKHIGLALIFVGYSLLMQSQLALNTAGTPYIIDFDGTFTNVNNGSYQGTGLRPAPTAGQLDSDAWAFNVDGSHFDGSVTYPYGGTHTIGGTPAALGSSFGTIAANTGGFYAFSGGAITGTALGLRPSNSTASPGFIALTVVNNTGAPIQTIDFSFDFYERNSQSRSTEVMPVFYFDAGNPGTGSLAEHFRIDYDITSMSHTSPTTASGSPSFVEYAKSYSLTGLYVEPGEDFEIVWEFDDGAGSGAHDDFAIDNITLTVTSHTGPLTFYSQTTPLNQNVISGTFNSSRQLWSTVPSGGLAYQAFPLYNNGTYVVQSPHTVKLIGSPASRVTLENLIVETGGHFIGQYAANSSLQRYLGVYGDIVCDGEIGMVNFGTAGAGIGFEFEPGNHTISGSGTFNCSRMRKSNANLQNGVCDLTFNMDVNLQWPTTSCLYNDRQASGFGTNIFNVNISNGVTVTASGNIGLDNNNPLANSSECGGSINVAGLLDVGGILYMTNNNNFIPTSVHILTNGRINTSYIAANTSGAAGNSFTMDANSYLEVNSGDPGGLAWADFSLVNNSYLLLPTSTIEYSRNTSALFPNQLEYRNLIISSNGTKSPIPGSGLIRVHEDLTIESPARLNPFSNDLLISGNWNNHNQIGFTEGSRTVTFDGLAGSSAISCGGTEFFNDIQFTDGDVDLNTNVEIINATNLAARVNLNGFDFNIRVPGLISLGASPPGIFVSEDIGLNGTVSIGIDTYVLPVTFPFGTTSGIPIYCVFNSQSGFPGTVTMATYGTGAANTPWPLTPTPVTNLNSTTGLTPDNQDATADRFWHIDNSQGPIVADLSLSIATSELPIAPYNDATMLVGQRWSDEESRWMVPSQSSLAGTYSPSTITVNVFGVTQFSPWAVTSTLSPLPVELLNLDAKPIAEGIEIDWTTASETNNSYFSVYRFTEAGQEEWIADVQGSGFSASARSYNLLDNAPEQGINYFHLYQTDFDGTVHDEGITSAYWAIDGSLSINSSRWDGQSLFLEISHNEEPYQIELFDSAGRVIGRFDKSNLNSLSFEGCKSQGLYMVRLTQGDSIYTQKISR